MICYLWSVQNRSSGIDLKKKTSKIEGSKASVFPVPCVQYTRYKGQKPYFKHVFLEYPNFKHVQRGKKKQSHAGDIEQSFGLASSLAIPTVGFF
jgi:hypothetical protein